MKLGLKCLIATVLITSSLSIAANAEVNNKSNLKNNSIIIEKETEDKDTLVPIKEILKDVDKEYKGSISIELEDAEKAKDKSNVKLSVNKVADVIDGEYKLTGDYSSSDLDLNVITKANDLESAANKLAKLSKVNENILTTDESGKGKIENLEVGVYLVNAVDIANYENITPFLISIPTWSEVDNNMIYDVNAIPKHSPIPEVKIPGVPDTSYNNKTNIYLGLAAGCALLASVSFLIKNKTKKKIEEK
ncbi:hypothetical protein [Clostridium sp. SGI.024]|uniref:hypothetical protein n=1 Tax=Clostridium sp. SGI.024 TaxID=3420551 RepID=UPI003CFCC323